MPEEWYYSLVYWDNEESICLQFNIIPLQFNELAPAGNQRLDARRKGLLWLAPEPLMRCRLDIVIYVEFAYPQGLFQWPKQMKIRRRQVWGIRREWQDLKLHVL
jgi:hypothetical protein